MTPGASFAARLTARVTERRSQIVLGLDPDPMDLWPIEDAGRVPDGAFAGGAPGEIAGGGGPPSQGASSPRSLAAARVRAHCTALIDAAGSACVAVKPQLARFEALGAPGWEALEATVAHARRAGLLVIADAKRGDIDVSARAYARALLGATPTPEGPVGGLGVDMVTVNPLMGADTVEPFVEVARETGAGLLVLVRTSNPGAAEIEDLELADGGTVWERIATLVDRLGRSAPEGGAAPGGQSSDPVGQGNDGQPDDGRGGDGPTLSDVGAVVGATAPEHLERARELMPRSVFLLPGVGAQGGRVEDLAPAFAPGPAAGLVTASRSIANAHRERGGAPADAARMEAERLRDRAWALATAGRSSAGESSRSAL